MEQNEVQIPTVEQEPSAGEVFSSNLDKIDTVIVDMLKDESARISDLQEAWAVRAVLAENFVDSLKPTEKNPNPRPRVQFDIMVDKAIIFETVGDTLRYLEELDCAEVFALNCDLDEVTMSIGKELDEKIPELGSSMRELILKLRGVIEFSNRDYLRELLAEGMDQQDLIGTIYGMILEEDGDPDKVLLGLGITE